MRPTSSYWAYIGLEQQHPSVDIWSVELTDSQELIRDDNGSCYLPKPIPRQNVALHTEGWIRRNPSSVACDVFWPGRHFHEKHSVPDLLGDEACVIELDGTRHEGKAATASWLEALAIRRRLDPKEGLHMYVPDETHALLHPWGGSGIWTLTVIQDNSLVAIREFASEEEARAFAGDLDDD